MKRRHFLATGLSAAAVASVPSIASAERLYVNDTNDGYLNLRTGPGTNYAIIRRIYSGMEVDAVGQSGSWRRVILPDGTTGWASGNFMSRGYAQQRAYDGRVVRTSDGHLNMRTGPGTNYAIIQRLYAGQGVYFTGRDGSWRRIQLADGRVGWASGNFIR